MTDLAAYLRARLDEEEATARAFLDWPEAPVGGLSLRWDQVHSDQRAVGWGFTAIAAGVTPQVAAHIACWDPARVLAEVAAKRAILDILAVPDPHEPGESCTDCSIVRLLAQPYADRADFSSEWRTEEDGRG